MKIISHRGNLKGRLPEKENRPSYIDCAIQLGYDVEIDLRYTNNKLYLGHDTADYEVSKEWIDLRKNFLWIHCKDVESAYQIATIPDIKCFCHTADPFVIVSGGYVWVHDLTTTTPNSIIPLMDLEEAMNYTKYKDVYGICSDYPLSIQYKINNTKSNKI
jgi:hypothetical protein